MRYLLLAPLLLWTLQAPAGAETLRMDVTYTDGHIVSGPLSAGLTELPTSVLASFTFNGSVSIGLADVLQASLVFGDGAWNVGDLQSFAATLLTTDNGIINTTSLTYGFGAINTPTTYDKLAGNFPLHISGTDVASGEAFSYQYDTSSHIVTVTPEPSSLVLAACGFAALTAWGWRRRKR